MQVNSDVTGEWLTVPLVVEGLFVMVYSQPRVPSNPSACEGTHNGYIEFIDPYDYEVMRYYVQVNFTEHLTWKLGKESQAYRDCMQRIAQAIADELHSFRLEELGDRLDDQGIGGDQEYQLTMQTQRYLILPEKTPQYVDVPTTRAGFGLYLLDSVMSGFQPRQTTLERIEVIPGIYVGCLSRDPDFDELQPVEKARGIPRTSTLDVVNLQVKFSSGTVDYPQHEYRLFPFYIPGTSRISHDLRDLSDEVREHVRDRLYARLTDAVRDQYNIEEDALLRLEIQGNTLH